MNKQPDYFAVISHKLASKDRQVFVFLCVWSQFSHHLKSTICRDSSVSIQFSSSQQSWLQYMKSGQFTYCLLLKCLQPAGLVRLISKNEEGSTFFFSKKFKKHLELSWQWWTAPFRSRILYVSEDVKCSRSSGLLPGLTSKASQLCTPLASQHIFNLLYWCKFIFLHFCLLLFVYNLTAGKKSYLTFVWTHH